MRLDHRRDDHSADRSDLPVSASSTPCTEATHVPPLFNLAHPCSTEGFSTTWRPCCILGEERTLISAYGTSVVLTQRGATDAPLTGILVPQVGLLQVQNSGKQMSSLCQRRPETLRLHLTPSHCSRQGNVKAKIMPDGRGDEERHAIKLLVACAIHAVHTKLYPANVVHSNAAHSVRVSRPWMWTVPVWWAGTNLRQNRRGGSGACLDAF